MQQKQAHPWVLTDGPFKATDIGWGRGSGADPVERTGAMPRGVARAKKVGV